MTVLQSPVGIFRLCFCRPQPGFRACDVPAALAASVGLMVAQGPFDQTTECNVGSPCAIQLAGIALTASDLLVLTSHTCDALTMSVTGLPGYNRLQQPLTLKEVGTSLQAFVGELPLETTPGIYQACWCPGGLPCSLSSLSSFRAVAGRLSVNCPEGRAYAGLKCTQCGRGFYCPGGSRSVATRVPCPDGETTIYANASSRADCVCARGHFFSSGACIACAKGAYKAHEGNTACTSCPDNFTTYLTGSISNSSCVAAEAVTAEGGGGVTGDYFRNSSSIPTVTFNLSLRVVAVDVLDSGLSRQLIATLRRSISQSTRMGTESVEIALLSSPSRRLSEILQLSISLKYPSQMLASIAVQELDAETVLDGIGDALQSNIGLSAEVETISQLAVSSAMVTCPTKKSNYPESPFCRQMNACADRATVMMLAFWPVQPAL